MLDRIRKALGLKRTYYCVHCWRGYNKRQYCQRCNTPTWSIDQIIEAAVEQITAKEKKS